MRETTLSRSLARNSSCLLLLAAALGSPAHAADGERVSNMRPVVMPAAPGTCSSGVTVPAGMADIRAADDAFEADVTPADADAGAVTAPPPPVVAEADTMTLQRDGVSRLEGNVWLQQGDHFLDTDALEFYQDTGVVRTLAPAQFGSPELIVNADSAVYDTRLGEGRFENADFLLPGRNGRGEADVLARTGVSTAYMEGVKYTTCPPDDEDWWLKASSMRLDQEAGTGVGRNVRVAFMGVPFFYLPWVSFPIDERRKTGFLFPEFGDSGRNGAWLRVPYYFNLAPNYDATIAPHFMAERGTVLESQFRYLFGWGAGTLNADYIDNDQLTDSHRYYYRLGHGTVLPADWRLSLEYRQVSDEEYFQDFSESGRATLISHLAQTISLKKSTLEYGAEVRMLRYQTVDPTIPENARPYEKWPEIDYYYAPLPLAGQLWLEVDGESVNFQRDDRLSGWRHHNRTAFSMDFGNPGLRMTPRVGWWQTEYKLEQTDGASLDISRGLPVASLDMQATFARPLSSGATQTLEPRLFYLYVPYRNQDDIPRFDTRNASDTLPALFQENRFTGPDRIGDANRVILGLSSALVDVNGMEWFSASLARAWHLDDRQVQLQDSIEPETKSASNYYAAVEYRPSENQDLRLDLSWEPDAGEAEYGAAQYQYRPADETVVNLAYRYRQTDPGSTAPPLEQVDVSFTAPVGGRWNLFGRAVYSLEDEHSQETLAGFEYESCCWIFRTFNRRYIFNRDGEFNQAIWFQLELKGLSSVGRRIDEFLAEDIYGYGETP